MYVPVTALAYIPEFPFLLAFVTWDMSTFSAR
jgi:hypothetical protein